MILVFLDPPNIHNNSICCNSEEIIIVIHSHWYVRTFADKINFVHSQGGKQVWVNCHRLIASNPEFQYLAVSCVLYNYGYCKAASVYRLKIKSTASANIHVLVIHFLTCAVLV